MSFRSRAARALGLVLLFSAWPLTGCAVGAEDDLDGLKTGRKDGGTLDSDEEDTSAEEDSDSSKTDTGSSSSDTGSSTTDTGSSSSDTGSSTTDTGPVGTPCTALTSADCASSITDLGSVSGDKGSGTKTASGSDSKFLRIRVTEDDSSLLSSVDLRVRVTLSPSKGNFDLYLYEGKASGDGGGVECATVKASSTNATGDDAVSLKWGDNRPIGGFDDSRVISIEVRATDTVCADASWSLLVEGNK